MLILGQLEEWLLLAQKICGSNPFCQFVHWTCFKYYSGRNIFLINGPLMNQNIDLCRKKQCDQIVLFLPGLRDKFVTKLTQIFGNFWVILKTSFSKLKLLWLLLGNFFKKIGLLLLPKSGHTGCEQAPSSHHLTL